MFRATFQNLMNDVVAYGSCTECAACVVVCPYRVIEYINNKPRQTAKPEKPQDYCVVADNIGCDVCAQVCPRLPPYYGMIDEKVFERPRKPEEESFGVYDDLYAIRTKDERILKVCQDGGLVTTVLAWGLETGLLDGAIVCGPSLTPCWPEPRIVDTVDDLIQTAGSWYTYCPNPLALSQIEKSKYHRLGFIGTSCQITPIVKSRLQTVDDLRARNEKQTAYQLAKLKAPGDRVFLTIGLLCCEVFDYEQLMVKKIRDEMGIPLETVAKLNVKGKVLVYRRDDSVIEIPLKEAQQSQRPECRYCADFAAEHADISAGGVGATGWTITIVRSRKGKEIMDRIIAAGLVEVRSIPEFDNSVKILRRLAKKSRDRVPVIGIGGRRLSFAGP